MNYIIYGKVGRSDFYRMLSGNDQSPDKGTDTDKIYLRF